MLTILPGSGKPGNDRHGTRRGRASGASARVMGVAPVPWRHPFDVTEISMSYPPQPGGWPDQQGGAWQGQPVGGWQDPAGGQQAYVDPASGQPAYVDPISGQPMGYPAQPPYSPAPGYEYQGYQPYAPPVMVPSRRTNGMSIAAMVVAIVGLLSSPCYGIAGIAIGWIAVLAGLIALGIYLYFIFWFKNTLDNYSNYPTPNYT